MAGSRSLTLIFQLATLLVSLLLNLSYVEARRGSSKYRHNSGGYSHKRGNDPLPWWAITFIFVGGILGIFFCVLGLKKIYEKKRKQKMRAMNSRRSINIQRRRSLQNTTTGEPQEGINAPPSYEQSAKDDAQPPAYCKDVNTDDEHAMPPPAPQDTSVPMETDPSLAPPSYDIAQTDGSEVVEVGGAVSMEMSTTDGGNTHSGPTNVEV